MDHVFSVRSLLLSVYNQSCTFKTTVLPFSNLTPKKSCKIVVVYERKYSMINLICIFLFFNSWDNNEREKMSPWDMEPIPEGSKYAFKNEL